MSLKKKKTRTVLLFVFIAIQYTCNWNLYIDAEVFFVKKYYHFLRNQFSWQNFLIILCKYVDICLMAALNLWFHYIMFASYLFSVLQRIECNNNKRKWSDWHWFEDNSLELQFPETTILQLTETTVYRYRNCLKAQFAEMTVNR